MNRVAAGAADRGRWSRAGAGRVAVWGGYALMLAVAPVVFRSGMAHTLLSQMGIAIIACLAYNILLGQGGMLSFGHAVYSGLGAYVTMHTLNLVGAGRLGLPVSLLPLVGGFAGLCFAALFGWVTTRKSGTPFAMITLGLGELVWSMSLMLPGFFGGEGGISGNRVTGTPVFGISWGPQLQLYYLIAAWCFVSTALMYALTGTPLGRMLNAVRDNPERVAFVGYDPQRVRFLAFMISGFFMGVAGALGALNYEIVTAEVVGAARSGAYLLFTFLGGSAVFFGPIIGGVLMVLALVLLSELTQAWLLYLGLAFMLVVMVAPGGIASLVTTNLRLARLGRLGPLAASYLALAGAAAALLAGIAAMVEMVYRLQLGSGSGDGARLRFLGAVLDARGLDSWFGAAWLAGAGAVLFEVARRRFVAQWRDIQQQVERETRPAAAPA